MAEDGKNERKYHTKWEGLNDDGTPRAVLILHEGRFSDILGPALTKLAKIEDAEEMEEIAIYGYSTRG